MFLPPGNSQGFAFGNVEPHLPSEACFGFVCCCFHIICRSLGSEINKSIFKAAAFHIKSS